MFIKSLLETSRIHTPKGIHVQQQFISVATNLSINRQNLLRTVYSYILEVVVGSHAPSLTFSTMLKWPILKFEKSIPKCSFFSVPLFGQTRRRSFNKRPAVSLRICTTVSVMYMLICLSDLRGFNTMRLHIRLYYKNLQLL